MLVVRPIEFTKKDKEIIPEELIHPIPSPSITESISANQLYEINQQEPVTRTVLSKQSAVEVTKKSTSSELTDVPSVCTSILTSMFEKKITVFLTWNKLIPFEFETSSLLSDVFNTFMKKVMPKEDITQYRLVKHLQPSSILPMDRTLSELLICNKTVFASMSYSLLQSLLYCKIDW